MPKHNMKYSKKMSQVGMGRMNSPSNAMDKLNYVPKAEKRVVDNAPMGKKPPRMNYKMK